MYKQKSVQNYINDLAAKQPVPGGGSAAAVALGLGAALVSMLGRYSSGKVQAKKIASLIKKNEKIRKQALSLVDEDAKVFFELYKVFKLPSANKKKKLLMQKYLKQAAGVPVEICVLSLKAMETCAQIAAWTNKNLISDAGCAAYFIESAFNSARLNVEINLKYIKDKKFILDKNKILKHTSIKIFKLKKQIIKKVEEYL